MGRSTVAYTCVLCGGTHSGEIEHAGHDDDQDAALRYVTGRRSPSSQRGPHCIPCLEAWRRALKGDHMARCRDAAKHREMATGSPAGVFSTLLTGSDPARPASGAWVISTGEVRMVRKGKA